MLGEISNPHDAFFKSVFGNLERSRRFFAAYLPQKLAAELDLTWLRFEKGSFVDEKLRQSHTDLLFRTLLKSGKQAWIYLLFEHQSTPEPDMPFRLLRYLVRIWDQHRNRSNRKDPLPFIVPVVLYHGKTPWTVPRLFSETLNLQGDVGIHPTESEYLLIDVSEIPDDRIMQTGVELALAFLLYRHIRDDDLSGFMWEVAPLLTELSQRKTGLEYLETALQYVYCTRNETELDDLLDLLQDAAPAAKEVFMTTIAEHFIQRGEERGTDRGKVIEAREVLIELLEEQFGDIPVALQESINCIESHATLRLLRRQRKTCRSLDEFEALLEKSVV